MNKDNELDQATHLPALEPDSQDPNASIELNAAETLTSTIATLGQTMAEVIEQSTQAAAKEEKMRSQHDKVLIEAVRQGSLPEVKQAITAGGNPHLLFNGANLMHCLGQNKSGDAIAIAEYLLDEFQLDINQKTPYNTYPIETTVFNPPVFRFYLTRGVNVNLKTEFSCLFQNVLLVGEDSLFFDLLNHPDLDLSAEEQSGDLFTMAKHRNQARAIILVEKLNYSQQLMDAWLVEQIKYDYQLSGEAINIVNRFLATLTNMAATSLKKHHLETHFAAYLPQKIIDSLIIHPEMLNQKHMLLAALLKKGTNPNHFNSKIGDPPLLGRLLNQVSENNNQRICEKISLLLQHGADPHLEYDDFYGYKSSPFARAIRNNRPDEYIKLMLLSHQGLQPITSENATNYLPQNHPCYEFLQAGLAMRSARMILDQGDEKSLEEQEQHLNSLLRQCIDQGYEHFMSYFDAIYQDLDKNVRQIEYLSNFILQQEIGTVPKEALNLITLIFMCKETTTREDLLITCLFARESSHKAILASRYCKLMGLPRDSINISLSSLLENHFDEFRAILFEIAEFGSHYCKIKLPLSIEAITKQLAGEKDEIVILTLYTEFLIRQATTPFEYSAQVFYDALAEHPNRERASELLKKFNSYFLVKYHQDNQDASVAHMSRVANRASRSPSCALMPPENQYKL